MSYTMSFETFQKLTKPNSIIPVFRIINADFLTPVMTYLKIRQNNKFSFLLESVIKGEQLGRYSFIGCTPIDKLSSLPYSTADRSNRKDIDSLNFFEKLKVNLKKYSPIIVEGLPRFTSGAVGYIGYDMVRHIEELPAPKPDPIGIPDAVLGFYHDLIAFDHLKNQDPYR